MPPAFRYLEGFRLECVTPDILHVADQGATSHLLGNIFHGLVAARSFGGANQQANLEALHAEMKEWYRHNKVSNELLLLLLFLLAS